MQAALQAFAHGANDIANAAGPMLAIVNLYIDGVFAALSSMIFVIYATTSRCGALCVSAAAACSVEHGRVGRARCIDARAQGGADSQH